MTEELITFETTVLAKEKGFNWECEARYFTAETVELQLNCLVSNWNNYDDSSTTYYSCPSQSLLQRWLREVHGSCIGMVYFKSKPGSDTKYDYWEWRIHYTDQYGRGDTYETALEAALQTALKLIV